MWPRPIPVLGDVTSAAQRAADPDGWAFDEQAIDAVQAVIAARRDIRRYRPDDVSPELLDRVLLAGHQAPSVGISQPWRFVVVREQSSRDRAALMADRERLRQAKGLTADRRARLLDLQLEGIREAPVGIVVACDRRTPAAGVLGRASFGDADMWGCACAVENMWLTARAHGLGLGWVTLFQPADLAQLLRLPDGVETLGWLCLGWPDERPPEPGLERQGWGARLALDDVVISERWPATDEPAPPVSHLSGPDGEAVVAGRDSGDALLTTPGSLGVLDLAVNRVLALNRTPPTSGTLVLVAADHPVSRHGVSPYPASVTADVFRATQAGVAVGATTARQAGLSIEAVHATAGGLAGDLLYVDALEVADVDRLMEQGKEIGRRHADEGLICLGEVGIGNTTVAAALSCVLLDLAAEVAVGLGAGADTAMLHRKQQVVSGALARAQGAYGDRLREPRVLLAALGGPEVALLTGVVIAAAESRRPVILDGLVTSVAALLAVRLEPAAQSALIAGQCSREAVHQAVLTELGLEPLLELRLRCGEGVGACLAAQMLLTGLRLRQLSARVSPE
jgi:nicotinate-nucleotide--dimethylbenzimidazole phosphoribosyltransferase